jgi:DNA repair protein RadA/Sms
MKATATAVERPTSCSGLPRPEKLVKVGNVKEYRILTKEDGFDNVLGGGLIPGVVVLLSGEPGIGKSTLLLQIANTIDKKVLYVNGEESSFQTSMRAERLGIKADLSKILLLPEENIEKIVTVAQQINPAILAIDSIQTIYSDEHDSIQGSPTQIKECTSQLVAFAKQTSVPVIIVGHITKDGNIAGPKTMEHDVDIVMKFTEMDILLFLFDRLWMRTKSRNPIHTSFRQNLRT